MNGLIPALVAVLLAEFGERTLMLANLRARGLFVALAGAMTAAAAVGGSIVAPTMNERAQTLMVGIALIFGGAGQLRRPRRAERFASILFSFWGGGALLLAFAFGAKFDPAMATLGTMFGVGGAFALSLAARVAGWKLTPLARAAGALLIIAGTVIALIALRLV